MLQISYASSKRWNMSQLNNNNNLFINLWVVKPFEITLVGTFIHVGIHHHRLKKKKTFCIL